MVCSRVHVFTNPKKNVMIRQPIPNVLSIRSCKLFYHFIRSETFNVLAQNLHSFSLYQVVNHYRIEERGPHQRI